MYARLHYVNNMSELHTYIQMYTKNSVNTLHYTISVYEFTINICIQQNI